MFQETALNLETFFTKRNQLPKPLFNDSPKETQHVGAGPETQGRRKSKLLWKESGATNHLRTQRNQPSPLKINPPNLSRKITCTTWKSPPLQNRTYPNLSESKWI